MSDYKQCPNGHYYQGDHCPYCATRTQQESRGPYECVKCGALSDEYNGGYCPYCGEQLYSVSNRVPSWFPSDITVVIPVCKHCGHRIRRHIPESHGLVSYIQNWCEKVTPWNYKWDGKCEYCGHDYNVYMEVPIDNEQRKKTKVYADRDWIASPLGAFDTFTVLSGVSIETTVGDTVNKVFLSAKELEYLIDASKNSPILKQWDFNYDGT